MSDQALDINNEPGTPITADTTSKWRRRLPKIALALTLIGIITAAIIQRDQVLDILEDFLQWVQDNVVLGAFLYALVYAVATVAAVPGLLLTLGAGFVFSSALGVGLGIVIATIVVFVGATMGALAAFVLGRTILRSWVASSLERFPRLKTIDTVLGSQGFKLVFLLRLSPLLPFNLFNYVMGVTAVSFRDYALGSLGLLPGIIAYVAIGSSLGSLGQAASGDLGGNGNLILGFIIGGTIAALGVSIYLSIVAKREINKVLARQQIEQMETDLEQANPSLPAVPDGPRSGPGVYFNTQAVPQTSFQTPSGPLPSDRPPFPFQNRPAPVPPV